MENSRAFHVFGGVKDYQSIVVQAGGPEFLHFLPAPETCPKNLRNVGVPPSPRPATRRTAEGDARGGRAAPRLRSRIGPTDLRNRTGADQCTGDEGFIEREREGESYIYIYTEGESCLWMRERIIYLQMVVEDSHI